MARLRGRPIRPIPVHPERVLSRAVKAGLSATIVLQRDISNKKTRKYYNRSYERWSIRQQVYQITKERGAPDFSHISKAEAPIRDDTRLIFYEKTANYGFTEVGRQKNTDDTVGSLNQRFNACGSVIRENSEIMFPLPEPASFGTYSRRDGKGRKKFRRAGYEGSSFGPRVILSHPDLPSLDFGDAVRSHNEYLATFCAIHDVPVRETTRYSNLFYLLVRPYLEHLYSEYKCGTANFQKGVNWALRQVKELILETGYRPTMHEKRTVTKKLELEESKNTKKENKILFKKHEIEAREFYGNHPAVAELSRLRGKLGDDEDQIDEKNESSEKESKDDALFTVKDVDHLRNAVSKRARLAGSIMHRRIADLFSSPWTLNDVIHSGDRYIRSSDYIIITEVPLQTKHGAGKVDLILCERTISDDGKQVFWRPVFVLEIKTRLGQSWYVEADYKESEVRPEGSHLPRVVSDFPLNDYPLSDELWDAIVQSTPTPLARKQLDIYSETLTESYENTTERELGHILKGVVVIEGSSDITEIRQVLERLIIHAYKDVKDRTRKLQRTVFTPPDSGSRRVALVIDKQPAPRRKEENMASAPWSPRYTPFKTKKKKKREFLLYLAGHSPTSAGQSAAWNARYYHGLQMLYEMKKTHNNPEFVWVDLANQFNEPRLAEARLRMRPRSYSKDEVAKVQPDHIRVFFESIGVRGYLDDILSFLYNDGNLPSFDLKTVNNKQRTIIITGADTLRDAIPSSHRDRLAILLDHLLSNLPDDERTTIVWFDTPVPSIEKSVPYSSRALIPYYDTSHLGEVVSEIIWNLPIAPKGAIQPKKWGLPIIGDAPMHDDIRVIIRHNPDNLQMELIHVPLLRGWSKRFKNQGTGLITRHREIDDIVPDRGTRHRIRLLSLTLLPWLVKLWPQEVLVEDFKESLEKQIAQLEQEYRGRTGQLTISKKTLLGKPNNPPSLLDLVKFRLPKTKDGKSFQAMTVGKINSQRLYRSPRKLQTQPLQRSPVLQPTKDVVAIEEELRQEWLFGIKFQSDDEDILSWWMVVQDPTHPSRMLIGCFTDRPPDKDGFLWAENKHEMLTQSSLDNILGFSQTIMIGRRVEDSLDLWSSCDGEAPVYEGVLDLRGQGRSTRGHLRAIRQTVTEESGTSPSHTIRPSESSYWRMVDSLRKHLVAVTNPTPVNVRLEMMDGTCHVILEDDESDVIQNITIEHTADLLSLLRRPMVRGEPIFTDLGEYVTWSIFDDIDYGELDFIRPYVTYAAARKTPVELPKRVSQFFEKAEELSVSIEHDTSVCPLALEEGVDHGACWRITLPAKCPAHIRNQLGRALTGEEMNGLLAPRRFYAGKLYTFDIILPEVSEKDESIVFHEERYIRMFLRNLRLPLKRLSPGTFLKTADQHWMVYIEWDDSYFNWNARSLLTTLRFKGESQFIELDYSHGAQEECERLLNIITSHIPPVRIFEYTKLKDQIMTGLKNRGYSKSSPVCELRIIEQSESICKYGVFLVDTSKWEPLLSYTIETTGIANSDELVDGITIGLGEGAMSAYNIRNSDSFLKLIATWARKHLSNSEETEEPKAWTVTLEANVETGEIHWVAEDDTGNLRQTGVMYPAPKDLQQLGQVKASAEIRQLFEIEVVPELEVITNLDEVMKEQIPDMVRRFISGKP